MAGVSRTASPHRSVAPHRANTLSEAFAVGDATHSDKAKSGQERGFHSMEPDGIEPTTSCLQSRRSPN